MSAFLEPRVGSVHLPLRTSTAVPSASVLSSWFNLLANCMLVAIGGYFLWSIYQEPVNLQNVYTGRITVLFGDAVLFGLVASLIASIGTIVVAVLTPRGDIARANARKIWLMCHGLFIFVLAAASLHVKFAL